MKKISVIVPIYNSANYLKKCLASLSHQTYPNLEFILIDDGSTDNSAKICKSFCSKDPRFQYIWQENSGVSVARNKGLEIATGDLIGFCDSDDWVEPDLYNFLYELMMRHNAAISVCGVFVDSGSSSTCKGNRDELLILKPDKAIEVTLRDNVFAGFLVNKLFNKSKIGDFRLDSEITMYEDLLLICELYGKANSIVFQNTPKYHYVQNKNSAIHSSFSEREWTRIKSCEMILEICKEQYPDSIVLAQKKLVEASLIVAGKLANAGSLDKNKYRNLKNIMKPYSDLVRAGLSRKMLITLNIFLLSRNVFNLYRRIRNKMTVFKCLKCRIFNKKNKSTVTE